MSARRQTFRWSKPWTWRPIETLALASKVGTYFLMITALDYAPNALRRRVLAVEYQGDALEQRLQLRIGGGWRMLVALWRMSSVNLTPALRPGDAVPADIFVTPLRDTTAAGAAAADGDEAPVVRLVELLGGGDGGSVLTGAAVGCGSYDDLPLVLNFGSCT